VSDIRAMVDAFSRFRFVGVGLACADPAWISLLSSEGFGWRMLSEAFQPGSAPAVLVVPHGAGASARRLANRLAALGSTLVTEVSRPKGQAVSAPESRALPYHRDDFAGVPNADTPEAVRIEHGRMGQGGYVVLPFRLGRLWASWRVGKKHVLLDPGQGLCLWHRQAWMVKKNVRRVVVDVLRDALFSGGLPLIRKWYWPGRFRSVFCLRGDADGGPAANLTRFLGAVRDHGDCTSVAFCTCKYLDKKPLIAATGRSGIEVVSHNHWHIVFPEGLTNRRGVRRAERILTQFVGRPRGFVAPAHFWHPSLYRALHERGYQYASSFGVSCDDWPFRPVVDGRLAGLVEIPTHPLGDRFAVCGIPLESSVPREFFEGLIRKKYAAGEPMILYGHPDVPGRMGTAPDLVRHIVGTALSHSDVWPAQLHEVAAWWRSRREEPVHCWYDPASGRIARSGRHDRRAPAAEVTISIETPDGRFYLVAASDVPPDGKPLEPHEQAAPLLSAEPQDVGEVVRRPAEGSPRPPLRRTIKRYIKAYAAAYLEAPGPLCASTSEQTVRQ
jgi:hypothetical protein